MAIDHLVFSGLLYGALLLLLLALLVGGLLLQSGVLPLQLLHGLLRLLEGMLIVITSSCSEAFSMGIYVTQPLRSLRLSCLFYLWSHLHLQVLGLRFCIFGFCISSSCSDAFLIDSYFPPSFLSTRVTSILSLLSLFLLYVFKGQSYIGFMLPLCTRGDSPCWPSVGHQGPCCPPPPR